MNVLSSFAFTRVEFDAEGEFESAKIHLHFDVYEMSKNEQFKDKAIQFATLNIAHEMIHMLTGKIYGETPSNNYKMSPDKSKFKVKVP
jgi:hypothetical protein